MINNIAQARPQRGINDADVLYEIMVEGGITRFMGLFLSLIHISEPTRLGMTSYAVFFLKKKKDRRTGRTSVAGTGWRREGKGLQNASNGGVRR